VRPCFPEAGGFPQGYPKSPQNSDFAGAEISESEVGLGDGAYFNIFT